MIILHDGNFGVLDGGNVEFDRNNGGFYCENVHFIRENGGFHMKLTVLMRKMDISSRF